MEPSAPLLTPQPPTLRPRSPPPKGKEPQPCRPHAEPDTCVICLSPISERAVTTPCNHLSFDFLCLIHWLQEQPNCPLCKTPVQKVEYDWRSPTDYKTYAVPHPQSEKKEPAAVPTGQRRRPAPRRQRPNPHRVATADQALLRRRKVYALLAFSSHVGANRRSEYASFTAASFATSPRLQQRARLFLRRELAVFEFLQASRQGVEFVLEYVVGMLKSMEIKGADGAMVRLVGEMLGSRVAPLLCHELEAWLRSPFDRLEDWDAAVQYADRSLMDGKNAGGSGVANGESRRTDATLS